MSLHQHQPVPDEPSKEPAPGKERNRFVAGEVLTARGARRFSTPAELLDVASVLPAGIERRDGKLHGVREKLPKELRQVFGPVTQLYGTKQPCDDDAMRYLSALAPQFRDFPDARMQLHILHGLAHVHRGEYADGIDQTRKAVELGRKYPFFTSEVTSTAGLHYALRALATHQNRTLDRNGYTASMDELSAIRKTLVALRRGSFAATEYGDVWVVGEGELGVSHGEDLGTGALAQCVALALHHPASNTFALAHLQNASQMADIRAFIRQLRRSDSNSVIRARVAGAILDQDLIRDDLTSKHVVVIFHELARDGVIVESADLFDPLQPRAVILRTKDFSFEEGIPTKSTRDYVLLDAAAKATPVRPLQRGPDLRSGYPGDPVSIGGNLLALANYEGDENVLAEFWYRNSVDELEFSSTFEPVCGVEFSLRTTMALHEALTDLEDHTGLSRERLLLLAAGPGLSVGPEALEANIRDLEF